MVLPLLAIPWVFGGLSAAAGALGLKKGVDAKKNYTHAKNIIEVAQNDFKASQARLEKTKLTTSTALADLGKLRIETEAQYMKRFVNVVQKINKSAYTPITLGGNNVTVGIPELKEMEASSYKAFDLLKDGVGAISSGVLVGVGASGLASGVGVVAGTGTAIGTLSGVAATNATLAWLGGGSLAAGGMGMAGGAAVLGGVIAGPVLAIMGFAAASKSETALTNAYEKESEIREGIEQVENGNTLLLSIGERSGEMSTVISDLRERFSGVLATCEHLVENREEMKRQAEIEWNKAGFFKRLFRRIKGVKLADPLDFSSFSQDEKNTYSMLNLFGIALYRIIKVKLLDDDGLVTIESNQAATDARTLLCGS
jgi:hypothetical protein